jgi:hypothetical protein
MRDATFAREPGAAVVRTPRLEHLLGPGMIECSLECQSTSSARHRLSHSMNKQSVGRFWHRDEAEVSDVRYAVTR